MTARVALAAIALVAAGCGGPTQTSSTDAPSTPDDSSVATTDASSPTTLAVTTTTVDPTIFDPNRVGDRTVLGSFVYTINETHVANGTPSIKSATIGFVNEPFTAYVISDFGDGGIVTEYMVGDGRYFQRDHRNFWTIIESGSLATPDILQPLETGYALTSVMTAVFVGEGEFGGIPAYHFTVDETNLYNGTGLDAEGEFYLAKDGNYPLYAHLRTVASGAGFELIDEYTETMSQPNELAEIALPADMLPLQDAFEQGIALGIPMPADGVLDKLENYNEGGIGVYYYDFTSLWKNEAEFIGFYQAMTPTNGWEVSHIGRVKNLDVLCGDGNCVIIKNGGEQVILYFDGINLHADWDREHRFSGQ